MISDIQKKNAVQLYLELGCEFVRCQNHAEAQHVFERLLALDPQQEHACRSLGDIYLAHGDIARALTCFEQATNMNPCTENHMRLALAYRLLRRFPDALQVLNRALKLDAKNPHAHHNVGDLFKETGHIALAHKAYDQSIALAPNFSHSYNNKALLLQHTGDLASAEQLLRKALEISPNSEQIKHNLGHVLLAQGNYAQGWELYESRYKYSGLHQPEKPDCVFPMWQGESLTGKTLLLWPEQGYGDLIQMIRFAQPLKEMGLAQLTVVCPEALCELFKTVRGVDLVCLHTQAYEPHDYWTFMFSLPFLLGVQQTNASTQAAYIEADPRKIALWRDHLPPSGLRVGFVWKGGSNHANDRHRSLPNIHVLDSLFAISDIHFVSLQLGASSSEYGQEVPPNLSFLGDKIKDFSDTAALIAQLDLVITVDTATAHLAGAMNKPCWVLLPAQGTDWRWLQKRNDSPWYPQSVRLFRQQTHADWMPVIRNVAQALRERQSHI